MGREKSIRRPKDRQVTVVPLESSSLKRDEVAVREDPNHGNALFSLLGVAFFFFFFLKTDTRFLKKIYKAYLSILERHFISD